MARTATAERTEADVAGQAPTGNLPANTNKHPLVQFKSYLDDRLGQIALALPPYMTPERFGRVVLTAIQRKPDLLNCTKESLFNSCMLAAQDGLLPDGREGAIVPYADGKKDQAQWMPMIEGLRKKARNSGEISNWEVHIVRARDHFEVVLGDQPRIDHKPYFGIEDAGQIIGAYSIAWMKDGTISRDVMTIKDIEKIKNISKAKNGPWSNATFFPEMCKKTVARRHYKQLPHAAEMDEFIKRMDEREGFDEAAVEARTAQRIGSTAAAFDSFAGAGGQQTIEHDAGDAGGQQTGEADLGDHGPKTGEVRETAQPKEAAKPADTKKSDAKPQQSGDDKAATADISKGDEVHRGDGGEGLDGADDELPLDAGGASDEGAWPVDQTPTNVAEYHRYCDAYLAQFSTAEDRVKIAEWFKTTGKLRTTCGIDKAQFDVAKEKAAKKINSLPPLQGK